jgi:hypothetical protein
MPIHLNVLLQLSNQAPDFLYSNELKDKQRMAVQSKSLDPAAASEKERESMRRDETSSAFYKIHC